MGFNFYARLVLLLLFAPQKGVEVEYVLPNECITKIEIIPGKTDCRGPAMNNLTCSHLLITYKPGCERLNVK